MILETAPTARTTLTRRVLRASADPMRDKDCNKTFLLHRAFVFSHEGRYSSRVKYLLRFILIAMI